MFARRPILLWLAVWLAAMLTYDYYARVEDPQMQARIDLHHAIVVRTAPYQYRYRVLIPFAAEAIGRLVQHAPFVRSRPIVPPLTYSKRAFVLAYAASNWLALAIMFYSMGVLVWRLTRYELAPFAEAVSAVMIAFTFRNHYYHPWSFWESAFFALGLLLIHRRRYWLAAALSLVALANRETAVFLLVAFVFVEWPNGPGLRVAVGTLVVWVALFFALHHAVGYAPSTVTFDEIVANNRSNLWFSILLNVLIVGVPLPLIWRGLAASPFLRRAALMLPFYLGLLLAVGYWWEIRYWITALPVVVPALASAAATTTSDDEPTR